MGKKFDAKKWSPVRDSGSSWRRRPWASLSTSSLPVVMPVPMRPDQVSLSEEEWMLEAALIAEEEEEDHLYALEAAQEDPALDEYPD